MKRISFAFALATACGTGNPIDVPEDAAVLPDATLGSQDAGGHDAGGAEADAGPIEEDFDAGPAECEEGRQRWCNDSVDSDWGRQTCRDGRWGSCVEPAVGPDGRLLDRPTNECACRTRYFTSECCEDQEDRDADGLADCLIPLDHVPPVCPTDGTLCSYCDSHSDCGGEMDYCWVRLDGFSFCSRDCSTEPCPEGYTCRELDTLHQCEPDSGECTNAPLGS